MFQALLHAPPNAALLGWIGLALAAPASAFQTGEVYWVANACAAPPCQVYQVDAGLGSATPFASIAPSPGQFAWSPDLSEAWLTEFGNDRIVSISSAGVVSSYATGIAGPTGLLRTSDGTLLVASYSDRVVYDATGGGDLSTATVFASGFLTPRNLLQVSTGEILLANQSRRVVYDISAGGDFATAIPYASGFGGSVYDLAEHSGAVYVSSQLGVFDITGGGDVSGESPHAWGRLLIGLAVDGAGRLLATEFETGAIFDITAGGDFSAASPVATIPDGLGDSALDSVPAEEVAPPSEPPVVPALGALTYGALASLLAATRRRRR